MTEPLNWGALLGSAPRISDELVIAPADIPGLYDVECPDGRDLHDLTTGQVINVARVHGWIIVRRNL